MASEDEEGNTHAMRWPNRRNREPGAKRPAKMLAWALVLGLLFGMVGGRRISRGRLRVVRNHINERPVSGDIVLVGIDEKSRQGDRPLAVAAQPLRTS